ncbi:response regulator [Halonatronum saccharophilum]|uniref:response regulator n=1 Tax=Halonatronum saccharophilum TaxID=150060 RepID=UPI001B7FE07E|nr:response regulator transcription factor [Halonatronum saccharophilum]
MKEARSNIIRVDFFEKLKQNILERLVIKRIKIIIADAISLIREGIEIILNLEEGLEVIATARDGIEAYQKVKEHQPDIVLMDIEMPRMNGIESSKKIKKDYPNTKIIAFTSFADKDYIIDMFSCGVEGYILKNIEPSKLI